MSSAFWEKTVEREFFKDKYSMPTNSLVTITLSSGIRRLSKESII